MKQIVQYIDENKGDIQQGTTQFISIAMVALAFLMVALAAGYFAWWNGTFSWFAWIGDLF